jgi:hypothetical protein
LIGLGLGQSLEKFLLYLAIQLTKRLTIEKLFVERLHERHSPIDLIDLHNCYNEIQQVLFQKKTKKIPSSLTLRNIAG